MFYQERNYQTIYIAVIIYIILNSCNAIAKINDDNWEGVSPETKKICNLVRNYSIPLQELPSDADKKILSKCDSVELYFGFKNPPNYQNARDCAVINHDYDVLTMLYANGKGVKRNLELAIHFACLFNAAPAEIEGRIKHLTKLKEYNVSKGEFNICDDITSGYMMGVCAGYAHRDNMGKQNKHLNALIQTFTPNERIELKKLLASGLLYFNIKTRHEMDMRGTGAYAFSILEKINLNDQMVKLIDKTALCEVAPRTIEQFKRADNELNLLYKKIQRKSNGGSSEFSSGITKKGIQKTERAWIKYKDAWVSFGNAKCPTINKETWQTIITKERVKVLKMLYKEVA